MRAASFYVVLALVIIVTLTKRQIEEKINLVLTLVESCGRLIMHVNRAFDILQSSRVSTLTLRQWLAGVHNPVFL